MGAARRYPYVPSYLTHGGTDVTRKMIDCRDFPGPCTLAISGEEEEVVGAQASHLAAVHDMADGPDVRAYVRAMLKDDIGVGGSASLAQPR
jgi:hypothetical protein